MKIPKAFGTPIALNAFSHNQPLHTEKQALAASTKLHADGEVARWWLELSDAGREEYVQEHPTSKYADYHKTSKSIQKRDEPAEKTPSGSGSGSGMGDNKSHEGGERESAPAPAPAKPKHEQPKKYHPPRTTAPKPKPTTPSGGPSNLTPHEKKDEGHGTD